MSDSAHHELSAAPPEKSELTRLVDVLIGIANRRGLRDIRTPGLEIVTQLNCHKKKSNDLSISFKAAAKFRVTR